MFSFAAMKQFDVPVFYRSKLISAIKKVRKENDKLKKDFTPTLLDFGSVQIFLARHFGFCYGVENAIEIAFKTIEENPGKRIYLLSEMIHNPQVNADLKKHGIQFLQDTRGKELVPISTITQEDIVLIPAFGTTIAMEKQLKDIGIETEKFNTTCPFVEKVWNRSAAIAKNNYTIIIHGKPTHEETRATFSHATANAPSIVVKDMEQTKRLGLYIEGKLDPKNFNSEFKNQYSENFDIAKHLERIGVVNQTTMLASDTQAIADYLKQVMILKYQLTKENIGERFADTRDTLCYATNDNQTSVTGMLDAPADLAIVVGGYNSSNTSHLVELCEERLSTYYINNAEKIMSPKEISHYNFHTKEELITQNFLPTTLPVKILITSGASCPDALVEEVIEKIISYYPGSILMSDMINQFQ
ncbi:MAG TPA: 4-hydroxy-3-methylbut-2-enyl diphosphate reductase [Niabella sp.]|nr:4-hydroxy-3-methylbut-2-enyl diphosphate reductase [Niabella sp.]HOZ97594.1 4-hydroxy-3-methylbut-2-enyl diphosphate reductase [Niabella sp.]HQW15732.1 4-hydroxy-3-methylbut-2-enyl diphosphate reductase [Niabella sp.]HQX21007.1 4-hydroxy-3-methylbut-2-enyl diphosphate reductase [Niabella sp.]HQX42844.1 4-hydroxy-3-methylbut-2-enyl diphosphate reductase [Niabella sp.]